MVVVSDSGSINTANPGAGQPQKSVSSNNLSSSYELLMNHLTMADTNSLDITSSATSVSDPESAKVDGSQRTFGDFIEDMPILLSDHDFSDEDSFSTHSTHSHHKRSRRLQEQPQSALRNESPNPGDDFRPSAAAEEVKRSIRNNESTVGTVASTKDLKNSDKFEISEKDVLSTQKLSDISEKSISQRLLSVSTAVANSAKKTVTSQKLSAEQFHYERNQLMTITVKYVATKIHNSFPPESPRLIKPNELPLDKFLLLLTSRLRLTLTMFMKGIIYLFRYMDIIYLLRYLNQSNNFLNYNDMGFELKKLIVGCFKLALVREKKMINLHNSVNNKPQQNDLYEYNWAAITGLPNHDINNIVKRIVSRMNGKLNIKTAELIRMKSEIYRFVRMVANEV
ncbi:hypothetical protein G9P44_004287 [Scheffersomyces stipitis]|nr:hypothetical protein G9P44_004287 [Scheffersomyces stipitis]